MTEMVGALSTDEMTHLTRVLVGKARNLCIPDLDKVSDDALRELLIAAIVDTLLVAERGPFFDAMMAP